MTARAVLATAPGPDGRTVLAVMRSAPPITLRRTGPGRVHLVSTAAGPLGGDDLALDIDVAPGTSLDVLSIASTLVLPGSGTAESLMTVTARVGAGASLRFAPEPTVLAAGCRHRMAVRLELAGDARVFWREEIVFGRHGETPGRCHSRFDATVEGRPLLRQEFTVGDPAVDASPAVYGGARCVGSTLIAGPPGAVPGDLPDRDRNDGPPPDTAPTGSLRPGEAVIGDGWAMLPLAGPGILVSALAPDAAGLRHRLERGEAAAFPH
ncbi:urease accessory protein UreD [Planobispora siamensis]|uniref:Urease accessory protein UreD n=1 Tax=Planobispora siamensis TaxID=936338 RepID=A0A8J3SM73_9ACTN|nr:urease accessory protein UreD [Planobispora siamensis]GIH92143.1 urease accessory protein UreD [Planobispora siamensis]